MIQCLATPTLPLSVIFPRAMSREGQRGHRENSIVLITAMIDRLRHEMSVERETDRERERRSDWDIGKAEQRSRVGKKKCA